MHRSRELIAALLVAECVALAALAWWPGARATPWPALAVWGAAFGAYGLAVFLSRRGSGGLAEAGPHETRRRALWMGAIAARLILLPAFPHFSDDIWRYIWDGWMARNGINPFLLAPAEAPEALRTTWWTLINNPDVPTIYPPGAQVAFLVAALIYPGWLLFKGVWVVADLAAGAALVRIADRAGRRNGDRVLLAYLFSPLLLVEVAWSGHLEPLGIALMLAGLATLSAATDAAAGAAQRSRGAVSRARQRAALLLGAGAAVKYAPLAALPAFARRHGLRAAVLLLALPALLYLPYLLTGGGTLVGLSTYAEHWVFNPGLFRGLEALFGLDNAPRVVAAGVVGAVALVAAGRRWSVERTLFWTVGAALLLSPTVHPWYALWVLPFAALRGNWPWLIFTGCVFLSYYGRDTFHATGVWPMPTRVAWMVHGPLVAGLVASWLIRSGRLGAYRFPRSQQVAGREQGGEGEGPGSLA